MKIHNCSESRWLRSDKTHTRDYVRNAVIETSFCCMLLHVVCRTSSSIRPLRRCPSVHRTATTTKPSRTSAGTEPLAGGCATASWLWRTRWERLALYTHRLIPVRREWDKDCTAVLSAGTAACSMLLYLRHLRKWVIALECGWSVPSVQSFTWRS